MSINIKKSVDLSQYFTKYNVINSSIQPSLIELTEIYNHRLIEKDIDISEYTDDYILSDVDRPDTLSLKLYNTTEYWWVNLVINNISFFDFPLSNQSISSLANYLYSTIGDYSINTYSLLLNEINNEKRKIKIIKNESIQNFLKDVGDILNV